MMTMRNATIEVNERLTEVPIVLPPKRPLEDMTIIVVDNDDNDDVDDDDVSSISADGEDDDIGALTVCLDRCAVHSPAEKVFGGGRIQTTKTTTAPRSIFSKYWKENPNASSSSCPDKRHIARPSSPSCVMSGGATGNNGTSVKKLKSNTYQYLYAGTDPYTHFGITREEEQQQHQEEKVPDADCSVNTYERMLGEYEASCNRPASMQPSLNDHRNNSNAFNVWMSFFAGGGGGSESGNDRLRHSAPSLRDLDRQARAMINGDINNKNNNRRGGVKSESALLKTPQKSCLRTGRFSGVQTAAVQEGESSSSSIRTDQTVVQFESKVEIHVFQPPVESWAANGWSSWFG
jgi:hypothetical protein